MGTQGPGRKRIPNREKLTAEDDALSQVAREAEARLAAKRAARAEAREIRMKELERQQKELFHSHKEDSERYSRHSRRHASMSDDEERMSVGSRGSFRVEERPDRDFLDKGSRTASTLSAATLASLGGASSRRGSCDTSFSVETEASIRDMKDSLAEAEEKYRKAMVSNAQLHNEKSTLMYQVETLKEELSDMEELLWESRRHCDDRSKEFERERQDHRVLQFQFKEMKETLRQTEELLTEVSELRLKSSSYCQEVSDLQEVLQWKDQKMAALERQREISDIIRIERDRLRDDVVRLRDLLKKHGIVVSPEVSTNGETGRGEAEDDVSAESSSRLAQEPSHGGRESMLGKVREQQPAEGSKQDYVKYNRCRISKRSQSLNTISTSNQTKPDALKPAKGFDKQARERQDRTEKLPGRNEGARKVPRNKGSEKILTKKFHTNQRQDGGSLFRNEEIKRHQMTNKQGGAAQMCEPKSITRLIVDDQALKGRTKPEVKSSVVSNRDVIVTEMEHSFDDQICKIQTNLGRTQLSVHESESQAKYVDLVSPVRRASTGKVHKSRLVPPRPAKDIILDNKAIVLSVMAAGKQNSLTQEKQKQDVAGNETPSSDRGKCSSAVDHISQNQERDGNTCRDVSFSEGEVVPDIPALGAKETQISVDSLRENEFVDKLAEIDGEGCDGQSLKDEDIKVLTDLVEKETFQSLVHQQQTVSDNLGSTLHEEKVLKNEGDLSGSEVSEGPSFETKLKPSEFDSFLPAEKAITGKESGKPEKLENWRIYEEEPVREAVQIQEKIQDNSSEHPECDDQTETPQSSTLSTFVPVEMSRDLCGLEKTILRILRGFVENQGFAAEISRILPDVPGSLNQWISDLEEKLKNVAENVSEQPGTVEQESTAQMTGIKLTTEAELPLKDLPERSKTPEDPESVEQNPAGYSAIAKDSSVSGMLEVASLVVHPQTYVSVDSRKVCEDIQDPSASDDHETTENTSEAMSSICIFKVEVIESSPEETSGVNSVDIEEEKQSHSDPMVTSCFNEFVFVESYFAEAAKTKMVESGSDRGLVDSATNQVAEVVAKTHKQKELFHGSQSCLAGPVEEVVEAQLKRYRMLSTKPHVGQSSKVRRLLEITADEIKAMAVPELVWMSLQEGRIVEDRRIDGSTGSNTEDLEELSVGYMDSCEEVDEKAAPQPVMQQQRHPVTEVVVEDVKIIPVASREEHLSGRKGFSLVKHKTDCKVL
ncbi:myosin-4 isoform X3 [Siniperca chuatsi]|uniref:myosin-4 isoform X3 n=1 Tax=Siniperca chuatsi TaxID=119488 RepID=UPI001CE03D54|nr:myosin-4 isoform X3 [Siniperca chuatsi]